MFIVLELNTEYNFKHKNLWALTAQYLRGSNSIYLRNQDWKRLILFFYCFEDKLNLTDLQKAHKCTQNILTQIIIEIFDDAYLSVNSRTGG